MQPKTTQPNYADTLDIHRLGVIYASYRIALAIIMASLFVATFKNPLVGSDEPILYAITVVCYFFIGVIAYITLKSFPQKSNIQLFFGLTIDVFAFTMMLFANGGPNIQMSMLYLVTVVAAFILLGQRQAIFITLFAVICVVYQQFFYAVTKQTNIRGFSNITLLSLSFLGTALLSNMATRRMRSMEVVAERQASQVARLNKINQRIIETMDNGVLVIDTDQKIMLSNKAAQRIMGLKYTRPNRFLSGIDNEFATAVSAAFSQRQISFIYTPTPLSRVAEPLSVQIQALDDENTLLFIERISKSKQQAQQMKLASLGRLTASIAHEIRNPIGAISQASQLLHEEPDDTNKPLYEIIHKQTQRVNRIIEDVLQLSRQHSKTMDSIKLNQFIPQFIEEHFADKAVSYQVHQQLVFEFNRSQLEQILVNLVENGLKHGKADGRTPRVQVVASMVDQYISIDILDNGEGISTENQRQLFEPFFTTAKTGTGLGLYLSRAFCEANGATLNYIPNYTGACFRITKLQTLD